MSGMDKKQRKAKKRADKKKMEKIHAKAEDGEFNESAMKSGRIQIILVVLITIVGAAVIIINS